MKSTPNGAVLTANQKDQRSDSDSSERARELPRCPTGIEGLDEITGGGLPLGRPTLICGSAGCGKTVLAIEFLVRGATQYGEPGLFVAFEERSEELTQNVRSMGFDLDDLIQRNLLTVDHVAVERSQIEETGEYDLEGLFIRVGHEIDRLQAKRVVLDTLESLFAGFENEAILRAELRRLFHWLKDKGVTAVVTAERGSGTLTRQGLEEYVSDCVILLDHRVDSQVSTRRLRIVKFRGAAHGTNEYPFLIGDDGVTVIPITSARLDHQVSEERIPTGVPGLDAMLGGRGYYRGSSILISGTAGSGKSSLSGYFADAVCRSGERCLYFAFEESQPQIQRNLKSIGLDLGPHVEKGLLRFHAARPTLTGLEAHLATMHKNVRDFRPNAVILDPISNLFAAGTNTDALLMVIRLIDHLKREGITAFLTNLSAAGSAEQTEIGISSVIDTWVLLRDIELGGERNRGLYVLKSRGMSHSNQIREFLLTDTGVKLLEVYSGPEGVLTGSMRVAQEAAREVS
ncbi:MAG TPA: circadian clock protein KaiC [Candidatus Polarisedimenticolia bacterium]|nr:circadian clock protein KaiC [Candidatus Polarisedimenticolia bacterium]